MFSERRPRLKNRFIMNAEAVNKEIAIEGADVRELYGAQDVYLEQIRSLSPKVKLVARGSSLRVLGAARDVEAFERKMNALVDYYIKYGHISKEVVAQAFSTGLSDCAEPVSEKDVIVFGNNGAVIRARTVNQRRLTEMYESNDLLFAVGPAGSGKTYTAIALAVRALKDRTVKRVILTRPAVEAGEKLGFLPGDMKEKLDPYLQPRYDALNDMIPDRAAGLHARPHARQRVRHSGRGAEHHRFADQDVPDAHGPQREVHRDGRCDADRPAAQERQRPDASDGYASRDRGHRHGGVRQA